MRNGMDFSRDRDVGGEAAQRLAQESKYLLYQIKSELNPENFTEEEVEGEFGTTLESQSADQSTSAQRLSWLEDNLLVEEYKPEIYRVTREGHALPDPHSEEFL